MKTHWFFRLKEIPTLSLKFVLKVNLPWSFRVIIYPKYINRVEGYSSFWKGVFVENGVLKHQGKICQNKLCTFKGK